MKWRIQALEKKRDRLIELRDQVQLEIDKIKDELERFEALQADADDAMRAHLMNGEERNRQ